MAQTAVKNNCCCGGCVVRLLSTQVKEQGSVEVVTAEINTHGQDLRHLFKV
jgi:hypothetical protein